jgi:hypothetical protein
MGECVGNELVALVVQWDLHRALLRHQHGLNHRSRGEEDQTQEEDRKDGRTGINRKKEMAHVILYNGIRNLDALTPPKGLV